MIPFRFFFDEEDQPQRAQVRTTGKPRFFRGASFFMDEDFSPSLRKTPAPPPPPPAPEQGPGAGSGYDRGRMIGPRPKIKEIAKPKEEELDLELVGAALIELESDF